MPIRLNLLAEAQAAEELRRRDPVKRALWIAALLVALMLAWAGSLQFKAMAVKSDLKRVAGQMNTITNEFKQVTEAQKQLADINHRLMSLHALTTNRFLNGNLLNALQQVGMDEIQLSQVRLDQQYTLIEETKPRTNQNKITPGKPATATERIVLTLDGKDSSLSPGDEVTKFKDLLGKHSYFVEMLGSSNQVNLKSLSAPQIAPDTGRAIVLFSLECRFPEKTR